MRNILFIVGDFYYYIIRVITLSKNDYWHIEYLLALIIFTKNKGNGDCKYWT
jgi:hypothetical protein